MTATGWKIMADALAGKPVPPERVPDVGALLTAYVTRRVDASDPRQLVSFGTSGHRGTPLDGSFTAEHIAAITQAICEYRAQAGITGLLFMGKDTHAVSGAAQNTALEVLAGNGVRVVIQSEDGYTPTPVISRAILVENRGRSTHLADGIVITPSHNPPEDGGFKYNPPNGGPADTDITGFVQKRANEILRDGNTAVRRVSFAAALTTDTTQQVDFAADYISDLASAIDFDAIRRAGIRIGVDPLGGASTRYWARIAESHGLDLTVVNDQIDPTFRFMRLDHDGKIRMDCSSAYAMAGLVELKDRFDIAFGSDPDADRHGIVTPTGGLMNPNYYLAAAIDYLLQNRPQWAVSAEVGKTLVSSVQIDRVVAANQRTLREVPVGFKWFAPGLFDGSVCFGGEESAGASFLRRDGQVWTTDKDGILLCLLAAEILAVTGRNPAERFNGLAERFGQTHYVRLDTPVSRDEKKRLGALSADDVTADTLAGDRITARLTRAPGNDAPIGGLKVITAGGWFAARPSGTEDIYKLYAESLRSEGHLNELVQAAQVLVRESIATKS
jgi:phosphoglucomutase